MALTSSVFNLSRQLLKLTIQTNKNQIRNRIRDTKLKFPEWYLKKQRVVHDDFMTWENREFINEVVQEKLETTAKINNEVTFENSPLKEQIHQYGEWEKGVMRTGLIARKLGEYPMWTKDGVRVATTLFQVVDNHVVKYIPPEEINSTIRVKSKKRGLLLVGAETTDPSLLTKEYAGIFEKSGVLPKKNLCRFLISPRAALPSGTPLFATHFRVGDYIDVRGKTIGRGFQGVMKRWGFSGMPASHGVTKTHRRPGNIGGGGEKGRVWPGTKMPGHMGFQYRILRGLEILRIDTTHNVIWVRSCGVPGPVNGLVHLYDTKLPLKKLTTAPPFPTHIPTGEEPIQIYNDKMHKFDDPTIDFPE